VVSSLKKFLYSAWGLPYNGNSQQTSIKSRNLVGGVQELSGDLVPTGFIPSLQGGDRTPLQDAHDRIYTATNQTSLLTLAQ
jgi:hypothetical protein